MMRLRVIQNKLNNKQGFLELSFCFDREKLVKDLDSVTSDEWVAHQNTQAYNGSWLITSLTSTTGETRQIVAYENQEYFDTPLLQKTPYVKSIIDSFKTKVESVRFMKLGANSIIKEHCDKGMCFEDGFARLHIPVCTNDTVEFILNGDVTQLELGKCYYINADAPHSVLNNGLTDRVHLLIDCHVNEWLKEKFVEKGFEETIYKYGSKSITDENVDFIIESFRVMNTETSLKMAEELENKKDKHVK